MNIVEDFVSYLRYEQRCSEETVSAYGRDLEQFLDFLGIEPEDFDPKTVSPSDIREWLADLSMSGRVPRSLRRKTQSLRAFFRYRMRRYGATVNPAADVTLAKTPRPLPNFIPAAEMDTLLSNPEPSADEFQAALDHVVMATFYATGIRRAELLSLTDTSISFEAKEMKVTGKRRKTRIIPLPQQLLDEIARWQQLRDSTVEKRTPPDRLFCGRRGTFSTFSLSQIISRMLAPTSAAIQSPHVLRHTFATAMLNGGADINSVKELLGHASLASTQIYTHLTFDELKKSYDSAHPRSIHPDDTTE